MCASINNLLLLSSSVCPFPEPLDRPESPSVIRRALSSSSECSAPPRKRGHQKRFSLGDGMYVVIDDQVDFADEAPQPTTADASLGDESKLSGAWHVWHHLGGEHSWSSLDSPKSYLACLHRTPKPLTTSSALVAAIDSACSAMLDDGAATTTTDGADCDTLPHTVFVTRKGVNPVWEHPSHSNGTSFYASLLGDHLRPLDVISTFTSTALSVAGAETPFGRPTTAIQLTRKAWGWRVVLWSSLDFRVRGSKRQRLKNRLIKRMKEHLNITSKVSLLSHRDRISQTRSKSSPYAAKSPNGNKPHEQKTVKVHIEEVRNADTTKEEMSNANVDDVVVDAVDECDNAPAPITATAVEQPIIVTSVEQPIIATAPAHPKNPPMASSSRFSLPILTMIMAMCALLVTHTIDWM